jgi:arylsulfatase A-like enzyme
VVIIFTDDQGYADVGAYGAEGYETPNLDQMASEGMRFTDFYVECSACSGSRAALLTGCYHRRLSLPDVLGPGSRIGLNPEEQTIADLLKERGYATAAYGKWHLGEHEPFLPTNQGFDDYFGLPYSNDMWPNHPTAGHRFPDLPLIDGTEVAQLNPDQRRLTTEYTEHAVDFIEENSDQPFFVYVAHSMPHVPLFVSDKFDGATSRGLYGDVIREIDWSVGRILETLEEQGVDENTLVIFTSDNGPWLSYGTHAGSAGPLREGKGTTFDGGQRVPFIARWPEGIPAGEVCEEPAMSIDLLPTIAEITGAPMSEREIDGKSMRPLLTGEEGAESPQEYYLFYRSGQLQAIRSGEWKLHFPHGYRTLNGREGGTGGEPVSYDRERIGLALFNLEDDIGEQNNVAEEHPDVVERLKSLAEQARQEIGDDRTDTEGSGVRPPGRL